VVFWVGLAIIAVGAALYVLSYLRSLPRFQRLVNANSEELRRIIESGEAREYGEGHEEFFKDALNYQLEHQVRPVPLVRVAIILVVVGALLVVVGYFAA
jgi:hypothetical protein